MKHHLFTAVSLMVAFVLYAIDLVGGALLLFASGAMLELWVGVRVLSRRSRPDRSSERAREKPHAAKLPRSVPADPAMPTRRKTLLWLAAALTPTCVLAQEMPARWQVPNTVPISAHLVTSGQPSASALAELRAHGFDAVIYLAPFSVPGAVIGEPNILKQQGIAFVNIPIGFGNPTDADFRAFAAALTGFAGRKVLVHCQVNMRASSMVFLYRVIIGKESPEVAYESVARIWSPEGPWKRLLVSELRKHGSSFEPY